MSAQELCPPAQKTALVLSGGGMRGAYEVGVLCGITEILQLDERKAAPFNIFVGTSVGAINSTFLAANAHRGDLNIRELANVWTQLSLKNHLRLDLFGLATVARSKRRLLSALRRAPRKNFGPSLLDPEPLESLVQDHIPWQQLHHNVAMGVVQGAIVTAFNVGTGRTTIFAQLAHGAEFRPSRDPRRTVSREQLSAAHVLASAAIPMLFPARRVNNAYYCDGGLRFNTPIAPAIRSGADRLLVVSPLKVAEHPPPESEVLDTYPNIFFLTGKLLNALLADPVQYDLHVLERFNDLMEVLEHNISSKNLGKFHEVVHEARGQAYRRLQTLVFMPTQDIGAIAAEHLRSRIEHWEIGEAKRWLLKILAGKGSSREADWASYLLFDGHLAERLIELGRRDALERQDEVREFFAPRGLEVAYS